MNDTGKHENAGKAEKVRTQGEERLKAKKIDPACLGYPPTDLFLMDLRSLLAELCCTSEMNRFARGKFVAVYAGVTRQLTGDYEVCLTLYPYQDAWSLVRGVDIVLECESAASPQLARTGWEGGVTFSNLPAGAYRLSLGIDHMADAPRDVEGKIVKFPPPSTTAEAEKPESLSAAVPRPGDLVTVEKLRYVAADAAAAVELPIVPTTNFKETFQDVIAKGSIDPTHYMSVMFVTNDPQIAARRVRVRLVSAESQAVLLSEHAPPFEPAGKGWKTAYEKDLINWPEKVVVRFDVQPDMTTEGD